MAKIFAPTSSEISEREKNNLLAVQKIASQGMVLLENDGTLPLTGAPGNIALYGYGVRRTVKGGTGSVYVNSRIVMNIMKESENLVQKIQIDTELIVRECVKKIK